MEWISVTSILIGLGGIFLAIFLHLKNRELNKVRYRYSWEDIQSGTNGLISMLQKEGYKPDVIISVAGSGGIVANLFMKLLDRRLPLYNILLENKADKWDPSPGHHETMEVARWRVHIPKILLDVPRNKNLVIVDSTVFTGTTLVALRHYLDEQGFQNIRILCLVDVPQPTKRDLEPFKRYFVNPTTELYYPWGKGT